MKSLGANSVVTPSSVRPSGLVIVALTGWDPQGRSIRYEDQIIWAHCFFICGSHVTGLGRHLLCEYKKKLDDPGDISGGGAEHQVVAPTKDLRDYDGIGSNGTLTRHLVLCACGRYETEDGLSTRTFSVNAHNEIEKLEAAILAVGILTDKAVRSGTLAKDGEKRKGIDEAMCYNCQRPGHMARDCRAPVRHAEPIRAVRPRNGQRACYECGSLDHLRPNCPKWNRERNQSGNQLALEGNRNTRGNENRARGRACNVNVVDALQDPNVVTGTYSLNNLYATVLFDSGADFSFISTKFAPLLNAKPSIANPGYVIEVANGKKEEVDRIFRGCRLELGDSMFLIDLIPLGQGSFDVIVGMDWLSNQKAVIVCHEKIVRIPVEGGKVLCVQGERNVGKTKTLMSTKANEPTLSGTFPIHKFVIVFIDDILIYSKTKEDHENHLRLMLDLQERRSPFEILERIGPVAYRLRLPEELSSVHDTFHVSNLKKCLADAIYSS
ncbi:putative reverse transcriptase domain-containing protein [Tanacetum coccineum]